MKTRQVIFISGLILAMFGIMTWVFFKRHDQATTINVVTQPIQSAKLANSASSPMVEAPKVAPAVPKDAPPLPVSKEMLDANAAERARRIQIAQRFLDQLLDPNGPAYAMEMSRATDDAARAQLEQQHQVAVAQAQQRVANLANPPEDIGELDLALFPAGPITGRSGQTYALKTGETFTLRVMNQASRGTEIMLSETMPSGHGTSNQRVTPTPRQPMVMFLNDGHSVQFTPQGTVNPTQPEDNSLLMPGAPPPPPDKSFTFTGRN